MTSNLRTRWYPRVAVLLAIVLFLIPSRLKAQEEAANLHILLVIDTKSATNRGAGNVRECMEANLKHLQAVINEAYGANLAKFKDRVFVNVLKGDDVSPEKIRQAYGNGTTATSASSVFFYYCGHGAFDKEKGHYLYTSGGDITRKEISGLLNNTRARSIIMITDCCSSYSKFEPPQRRVPAKWKALKRLFFDNKGVVDITAATEGEFGWCSSDGGMFTRSLCKYLCEPNDNVNWTEFFANVKQETMRVFQKARDAAPPDAEIRKSQAQTPYAWSLGGWYEQFTRRLELHNATNHRICVWLRFYDRDYESGKWAWYPGGGKALSYEIAPGKKIYPAFNNYPIEANAIQIWANSVQNPRITWGNNKRVIKLLDRSYRDQLGLSSYTFNAR